MIYLYFISKVVFFIDFFSSKYSTHVNQHYILKLQSFVIFKMNFKFSHYIPFDLLFFSYLSNWFLIISNSLYNIIKWKKFGKRLCIVIKNQRNYHKTFVQDASNINKEFRKLHLLKEYFIGIHSNHQVKIKQYDLDLKF